MSSFQMTCMILWQENINRFSFSDMYNYPDENKIFLILLEIDQEIFYKTKNFS